MIPIYLNYRGKRIYHYVDPFISLANFKDNIVKLLSLDRSTMRMIYAGKILTDELYLSTMSDVGVKKESCININGQPLTDKIDSANNSNNEPLNYLVFVQIKYDRIIYGIRDRINCYNSRCSRIGNYVICKINNMSPTDEVNFGLKISTDNNNMNLRGKNRRASKYYPFTVQNDGQTHYQMRYYNINVQVKIHKSPIISRVQSNIISGIIGKKNKNLTDNLFNKLCGYNKWHSLIEDIRRYLIRNNMIINDHKLSEIYRIYENYLQKSLKDVKYIKVSYSNIATHPAYKDAKYIYFLHENDILMESFSSVHTLVAVSDLLIKNIPFELIKDNSIKSNIVKKLCHLCGRGHDRFVGSNDKSCDNCYSKHIIDSVVSNVNSINVDHISKYVLPEELNRYGDDLVKFWLNKNSVDTITCPNTKCSATYGYDGASNSLYSPSHDIIKREMSDIMKIHYASSRILCRDCNTEFCKKCNVTPYHTGFTCGEYKEYIESEKCKYCLRMLDKKTNNCTNDECIEYNKLCTQKYTSCNHPNYGFSDYELCFDCCNGDNGCNGDIKNEECYICMTDELFRGPCIKLDCGHIFHLVCIKGRFENKYGTQHINLNYTYCPTCYFRISHPYIEKMYSEYEKSTSRKIEKKAYQHMKDNKDNNDQDNQENNNDKNTTVTEYINKLRYYECTDCHKIYLGGLADCQEDAEDNRVLEKRCLSCGAYGKSKCNKHGDKSILYKCCYCCEIAVWHCFGTTHFCEPCHNAYINHTIEVKECEDRGKCPLNGEHPTSDKKTRFAVGCSQCLSDDLKKRLSWKFNKNY